MERYHPPELSESQKQKLQTVNEHLERPEPIEKEQGIAPKEAESHSEWVDRGIQDVPLETIDFSDNYVKGPGDFQHGSSYNEMARGMKALEEDVRPAVERGEGADYFRELDQQRGLDYAHGSLRAYDTFYGRNAISLTKIGDHYQVANGGYHRLYVARELQMQSIPAHVIEKVPA